MKKLKLNNEIFADEEKFISTMTLLQASTGGGKSWAIRRILEQSFGKVPHIVLDTEGEFATLRERHDYILIGKDYDIAADPKTAGMMALRLWEEGVSAIIDLYELSPWDRQLFVKNFVDAMVNAPKKYWNPVLLVIDEAHEYAPEGDRTESGRALHLLASKGRKRDIGVIFATQRIATLSKNVVAACKNKLIGYTSLMNDMKRANDELGFNAKDLELRKLEPGEFFAFGPAISREIIRFQIGEIQTTHGSHGSRAAKVAPASEKVKKALARLADIPNEAKQELETIASLKREISELKKNPVADIEALVKKGVDLHVTAFASIENAYKNKIAQWKDYSAECRNIVNSMTVLLRDLKEPDEGIGISYIPIKEKKVAGYDTATPNGDKSVFVTGRIEGDSKIKIETSFEITTPERKVLNAVAWLNAVGIEQPESTAVALVAGYSPTSGGYANIRGTLRSKGLVEYGQGTMFLTNTGKNVADAPSGPFTNEEVHRMVLRKISAPEGKVLQPLLDAYPESVPSAALAERSGYSATSGGFANLKGRLKSLGIIEYPSQGYVKARSILFPNN